ncbi:MAG: hypothetical protein IJS00_01480 [Paludibacteraceae bacterium]|nr:hypothetical protein [Paludibacteraceae bacterium]
MKKLFMLALSLIMVASLSVAYAGNNQKEAKKLAKKEAKKLIKQGWQVSPGALPLDKQLEEAYMKQFEKDDTGYAKYYIAEAQSIGENYDAAKYQGIRLATENLAAQIQTEVTSLVENNIANAQLGANDAASITKTVGTSKNLIAQSIGRTLVITECYRVLPNKNREVLVRIAYSQDMAREAAKKAIRKELEKQNSKLQGQLDEVLGF